MERWERTREPLEQKVGWRWLVTKWFRDPDNNEQEYVTVGREGSRSVAVIALTPDKKVVVAEQFRPGPERVMQELPGGGVDENEDTKVAALRELREETGYVPKRIEQLGQVYKGSYINSTFEYFIAYDCTAEAEKATDEGEFISVRIITIKELLSNGRSGKMTDVEALFLAYEKLKELEGSSETAN